MQQYLPPVLLESWERKKFALESAQLKEMVCTGMEGSCCTLASTSLSG